MRKKYIDYERLRDILNQRKIVRDTPERREEIGEIIAVIDNMAEPNEHEELNEALDSLGRDLLEGCRDYWQKRIKEKLNGANWIPVSPETMPPYTGGGTTDALLLRVTAGAGGLVAVYTGFRKNEKWHTYMYWQTAEIDEGDAIVTHWMPIKELLRMVNNE